MNQTHNPVVAVCEHHKPLDHLGIFILLKLIYYIQCQVMPTSTTLSPTITDHHAHTLAPHTSTHQCCINNNGSKSDQHQQGQHRGSK